MMAKQHSRKKKKRGVIGGKSDMYTEISVHIGGTKERLEQLSTRGDQLVA